MRLYTIPLIIYQSLGLMYIVNFMPQGESSGQIGVQEIGIIIVAIIVLLLLIWLFLGICLGIEIPYMPQVPQLIV
jgi:hypothetical protein